MSRKTICWERGSTWGLPLYPPRARGKGVDASAPLYPSYYNSIASAPNYNSGMD